MGRLISLVFAVLAASAPSFGQASVEIALKQGSPLEAQTRDQLQRLMKTYDLSPWLYTKSIVIDERAIPFSHPVLTLNTRHLKDDDLLLSTFVHEQFHWFLVERDAGTKEAINELRKMFPSVPSGGTQGARDMFSTYLHLIVCYLEHQANLRILGELRAKQVLDFWATDHYTWIYQTVAERGRDIGAVVRNHKLISAR